MCNMRFIFNFDKVNIIQFCIILMIVFQGNGFPMMHGSLKDCVMFASHDAANDNRINWEGNLPWKVQIQEFQKVPDNDPILDDENYCGGILITNKHALVAASCILQGKDPVVLRKNNASLLYTFKSPNLILENYISKIYVHKNYSDSTHDFDISIIELKDFIELSENVYPAILSQTPLAFHHGNQLHVAIVKSKSEKYLERVNASVWSKEECSPNDEHLMCIETDTNCDDLVQPNTFPMQSISPIFYVAEQSENSNAKMEILGIPMGCKRIDSPISKSALVYLRVADLLPWIQNIIFDGGAECVIKTPNILDSDVYSWEM